MKNKEILKLKEDHDDLFKAVSSLSKRCYKFVKRLKNGRKIKDDI